MSPCGINWSCCSDRSAAHGFVSGSNLLRLAVTPLDGLAVQRGHRPARHRPRLAPPRLPTLLALEVPTAFTRSSPKRPRTPHADSTHGPRQPHLGPAPDPRAKAA